MIKTNTQPDILTLDQSEHEYYFGERRVGGVTKIVNGAFGEGYRFTKNQEFLFARGKAVHQCIHLWLNNDLVEDSIDPQILGRVNSLRKFVMDSNLKIIATELSLFHPKLFFAGTIDCVASYKGKYYPMIFDWKGSIDARVRLQLAAYSMLYEANHEGEKVFEAAAVKCNDDESYKTQWLDWRELEEAKRAFIAGLSCFHFAIKHGIK